MFQRAAGVLFATSLLFTSSLASAAPPLQPLSTFYGGAEHASPDVREAESTASQREAEVDVAWGRILPALTARATYTRNQVEVSATVGPNNTVTITPLDQLDATFAADVPIVDVGAWKRISAARASQDAAHARARVTLLDVKKGIARSYYQLVGARALSAAAAKTIAAAEANVKVVRERRDAGRGSDLDVERAVAELERAKQSAADASYLEAVSSRALASASGIAPNAGDPDARPSIESDALPPLSSFESTMTSPLTDAASLERRAAEKTASASRLAFLPTLSAFGNERLTNATGFSGRTSFWQVGAVASWRFDFATLANVRASDAAASAADARLDRARITAADRVHDDWQLVAASLAKSRAARAQVEAAEQAATHARDRFAAGNATQLDVVQAEREAFAATAARIQADAELAWARAALDIDSGRGR